MSKTSAGTDELRTERLVLRPLRESDLDALAAIYADPQTMRYLGGPRTRDHTSTGLEWMIAAHRDQGFGLWATTLVEDATLIGRCMARQAMITPSGMVTVVSSTSTNPNDR